MGSKFQDILDIYWEWATNHRAYEDGLALSMSVFQKDKILFQGGYGYADLDSQKKASVETLYRVASISKLFTATAILQLVEKGAMNLDDQIHKILPEFQVGSSIDYSEVTIRNLLTHSSGLPRESNHSYWASHDFPDKESVVQGFLEQEQVLPRNAMWKYSNLGYAMLGDIVARVSGKTFEEYVEENIFERLNLRNSFFRLVPSTHTSLLATGYKRLMPGCQRRQIPLVECGYLSPAANLDSNVVDLTVFVQSFFNHKEVLLKQKTIDEMLRCQIINDHWQDGYSLGFKHTRHGSNTLIGHGGGFQGYISHLSFIKEKNIGIIALMNSTDSDPHILARSGYDFLLPELSIDDSFVGKKTGASSQWEGRYRNEWSDVYIHEIQGQLYCLSIKDPNPFDTKSLLVPIGDQCFRVKTNLGGQCANEKVFFDTNAGVKRLRIGSNIHHRIEEWLDPLDL